MAHWPGALANLLIYKFHSQGQLYLLGYTIDDGVYLVYLEAIGLYVTQETPGFFAEDRHFSVNF